MRPQPTSRTITTSIYAGAAWAIFIAILGMLFLQAMPKTAAALFALASFVGFRGWITNLKSYRSIRDTPRSRIDSAAQGYVELDGHVAPFPGLPLKSPVSGSECVWYRYHLKEDKQGKGDSLGVIVESESPFLLIDAQDKGCCAIDPLGVHLVTLGKPEWRNLPVPPDSEKAPRYQEWLLQSGDYLHAVGEFKTMREGESGGREAKSAISQHMDWFHKDQKWKDRFDLDGDGKLDSREQQLAEAAVQREIQREPAIIKAAGIRHWLYQPDDGRPFILGSEPGSHLQNRYLRNALIHLIALFVAFAGLWNTLSSLLQAYGRR